MSAVRRFRRGSGALDNERMARADAEWDRWVEDSGAEGDFLQTSGWAEIDAALNGRGSGIARSGTETAGLVSWPVAGRGGELRCLNGPVIRELDPEQIAAFADLLLDAARDRGCDTVRIAGRPPLSAVPADQLGGVLAAASFETIPWFTSVVDLGPDEDALLARIDRSVRKALRRCASEGVTVRRCESLDDVQSLFYDAYATAVPGFDRARGPALFALDRLQRYSYWVACDADGGVLATLGTYRYRDVCTEILSSRTPLGVHARLPAQDLLHWEVMRDHRNAGGRWFDFAGYAADPQTPKEEGISRFKRKWGGREVATPSFVRPATGKLRRSIGRVRSLVR